MLSPLKSTIRRILHPAAARIVGHAGLRASLHWTYLEQVLKKYAIDCIVDVGANAGQFGEAVRAQTKYRGRILSFEPVAATFAELEAKAAADPAWHAYNAALGADARVENLMVRRLSELTSFLPSKGDDRYPWTDEVVATETIPVHRLDDFATGLPFWPEIGPTLLKLDTQGYDLEVFKGASGIEERIVAIQAELSIIPIYEGMPDYADTISFFQGHGYRLASVAPVTVLNDALIEIDCLFVRPDKSAAAAR